MRPGGGGLSASTQSLPRLVLLAATEAGYRNLLHLNSRAFLDHPGNEPPHIKLAWLDGHADGLICLTGGPDGPIDRIIASGQPHLAASRIDALLAAFGDRLYVELQRHGLAAGAHRRARAHRSRLSQGHSARRHQRAVLRHHRRLRGPRRAPVHRRGARAGGGGPPPPHHRAPLQDPRRDDGAVRRPAGGTGLHRRDRRAVLVPPGGAQAYPAAIFARRAGGGRRGQRIAQARRGRACPPHRRPWRGGRHHRRAVPRSGSPSSSASSSG